MKVGDDVKLYLPGESPWGIVIAVLDETRIQARINNKLFREYSADEQMEWIGEQFGTGYYLEELHGYKYGDVATFIKHPEFGSWELAPLDEQAPVGPHLPDREAA